ncbi:hypothetical protein WMF37_27205 [Sorangium sp. So ce291]|uniref:hypothetical protein n=1 Tax=Sorangium sp. So ce291 TaxID=3133294 RepID=UPI003F603F99
MSVNRWKLFAMPVALLGLASPLLVNCGGKGIPGADSLPGPAGDLASAAGGCEELKNGGIANLKFDGGAEVEGKVKGFLEAAASLDKLTADMEASLIASCGKLGKDLGMSEADLKAEPGGGKGAEKVCNAVSAKVNAAVKANAEAKLTVQIEPPKCYADISAMQKCLGDCGSPVQPGKLEASCEGGEISGKCDAECKGKCSVEAGAACSGTCNASCSGKCDAGFKGTCGGKCDGKCDGKDSKGAACAGTCDGKCDAKAEGSCSGTCDGSCSGSCELKAGAKCSGSCSGGCSAEIKEPKCSGEFKPPSVDPSCQVQCTAKTAGSAKCDPPGVRIVANGKVNADAQKLVAALQASLPAIVKIQLGTAKKLQAAVGGVISAGAEMNGAATKAGGKAIACVATAVEASANVKASLDVNIQASASVSGSASGSAKGGT